jgi:hypothetical protein
MCIIARYLVFKSKLEIQVFLQAQRIFATGPSYISLRFLFASNMNEMYNCTINNKYVDSNNNCASFSILNIDYGVNMLSIEEFEQKLNWVMVRNNADEQELADASNEMNSLLLRTSGAPTLVEIYLTAWYKKPGLRDRPPNLEGIDAVGLINEVLSSAANAGLIFTGRSLTEKEKRYVSILFAVFPAYISHLSLAEKRLNSAKALTDLGKLPPTLTSLDLSSNRISKKEALVALGNIIPPFLTNLNLRNNRIKSVEALAALANLPASITNLNLRENGIKNAEALAALAHLPASITSLDLSWNGIESAEAIAALAHLPASITNLNLGGNGIESAEALAALLNALQQLQVTNLNLSNNSIGSAEAIAVLVDVLPLLQLTSLDLSSNSIGSAEAIAALVKAFPLALTDLDLSYNGIKSVEALAALARLPASITNLDLSHNGIKSVEALAALARLPASITDLDLSWNWIESAERLAALAHLPASITSLDLSWNGIESAERLAALANLPASITDLDLSHNSIGTVEALAALVDALQQLQVTNLNLSDNYRIGNVEALAALANLPASITSLNLRNNSIGTVEKLVALVDALQQLQVTNLNLSENGIGTVEKLAVLANLPASITSLNLSENGRNGIESVEALAALAHLPASITSLNLCGSSPYNKEQQLKIADALRGSNVVELVLFDKDNENRLIPELEAVLAENAGLAPAAAPAAIASSVFSELTIDSYKEPAATNGHQQHVQTDIGEEEAEAIFNYEDAIYLLEQVSDASQEKILHIGNDVLQAVGLISKHTQEITSLVANEEQLSGMASRERRLTQKQEDLVSVLNQRPAAKGYYFAISNGLTGAYESGKIVKNGDINPDRLGAVGYAGEFFKFLGKILPVFGNAISIGAEVLAQANIKIQIDNISKFAELAHDGTDMDQIAANVAHYLVCQGRRYHGAKEDLAIMMEAVFAGKITRGSVTKQLIGIVTGDIVNIPDPSPSAAPAAVSVPAALPGSAPDHSQEIEKLRQGLEAQSREMYKLQRLNSQHGKELRRMGQQLPSSPSIAEPIATEGGMFLMQTALMSPDNLHSTSTVVSPSVATDHIAEIALAQSRTQEQLDSLEIMHVRLRQEWQNSEEASSCCSIL